MYNQQVYQQDPSEKEVYERCGVYVITLNRYAYIGACQCSLKEELNNIELDTGSIPNELLSLGAEFIPLVAMKKYSPNLLQKYKKAAELAYSDCIILS